VSGGRPAAGAPLEGGTDGFTLIEILVAVVVLSVGIVAVLGAFDVSLRAAERSRDAVLEAALLRERVQEVEAVLRATGSWEGAGEESFRGGRFQGFRRRTVVETADMPAGSRGALYAVSVAAGREGRPFGQTAATLVFVPPRPEQP
jgi:type II secretion system protein I